LGDSGDAGGLSPTTFPATGTVGARSGSLFATADVRAGRPYDLVVFMDGDTYLRYMGITNTLANLAAQHKIAPTVAALVTTVQASRDADFDCTSAWSDFIVRSVVATITRTFGRPARTVVAGYSLGGLAAACTALDHPQAIDGVIAQSGSFYRAPDGEEPEWLARRLSQQHRLNIRWAVTIGRLETGPFRSKDPSMLTASRHLRDVLRARGYDYRFTETYSGHELLPWRATIAQALMFQLGREAGDVNVAPGADVLEKR
jgi:enterochelin esterase-like enzyme